MSPLVYIVIGFFVSWFFIRIVTSIFQSHPRMRNVIRYIKTPYLEFLFPFPYNCRHCGRAYDRVNFDEFSQKTKDKYLKEVGEMIIRRFGFYCVDCHDDEEFVLIIRTRDMMRFSKK